MLAEVADWHRNAHHERTLIKCLKNGWYRFKYEDCELGMVVELTEAEAVIFDRHVTCPARLADLEDLPRRLRVAKLLALIA